MPRLNSRAVLIAALLVVGGCASQKTVPLPEIQGWEARTAILAERERWAFSGRVAVSANDDGFNGKIRWNQDGDGFLTTVSGPLGVGKTKVENDGVRTLHTDKDGVQTELVDAEAELYYRYGWTIPVRSLRYWALGIPDPSLPAATEFGEDGELTALEQGGWTVSISQYRDFGAKVGENMPRIVTAKSSGTRVRIVIDKWQFFD
ncbi:MAG: lipoprotein insertase outer membrane protein LolB [Pseudomonadota bacterium]